VKASYGVENPLFAVSMLAQTSMRSELGRIDLDAAFSQRDELNQRVVASLTPAAREWGLEVLRYEIKDILPPPGIRAAMELVAEADRKKRASILQSEGDQQKRINTASGEAEAIFRKAEATARSVRILAESIKKDRGAEAVRMRVAEQYVEAFGNLAKEGTTVLLPPSGGFADAGSMVAQAMTIFDKVRGGEAGGGGGVGGGGVAAGEVAAGDAAGDAADVGGSGKTSVEGNGFTLDSSKRK
jgi:regulator of protease activity HflC (stomatin/prohibitin superfamily)